MLEFHELQLCDKAWIQPYLQQSQYPCCEYNFTTMFMWQKMLRFKVAQAHGMLIVLSDRPNRQGFLFPIGNGDLVTTIGEMKTFAQANGFPCKIFATPQVALDKLNLFMKGQFTAEPTRDYFDYVYTTESLTTLRGKKLHSKRNHMKRFQDHPWLYERITPENIEACKQMNYEWCEQNDCASDSGKHSEACAVLRVLDHFFELDVIGGILRQNGNIVAYTVGEKLNDETFLVHIEKAFSQVQGAYATINNAFAKDAAGEFLYINREDDSGQEGLRKAKLSYHPAHLLEKFTLTIL